MRGRLNLLNRRQPFRPVAQPRFSSSSRRRRSCCLQNQQRKVISPQFPSQSTSVSFSSSDQAHESPCGRSAPFMFSSPPKNLPARKRRSVASVTPIGGPYNLDANWIGHSIDLFRFRLQRQMDGRCHTTPRAVLILARKERRKCVPTIDRERIMPARSKVDQTITSHDVR